MNMFGPNKERIYCYPVRRILQRVSLGEDDPLVALRLPVPRNVLPTLICWLMLFNIR